MKHNLADMPKNLLTKIARDISIEYTTQEDTARRVASYYRAYGLLWSDFVARYGIRTTLDGKTTMHS